MADLDELKDLGVPEKKIEGLKEEDRKMSNAWNGRPQNKEQYDRIWKRTHEERAAKLFALQPFSKMSDMEVLQKAGYTDAQLANAKLIVKSLSNSSAFTTALARHGVGPKLIAALVAEGVQLKVPLRTKYNEIVVDDDGNPVMVPDHERRLAYLDRAMKMTGAEHKAAPEEVTQINPVFITIMQKIENLPPEQRKRVAAGDFSALDGVDVEIVDTKPDE